MKKKRKEKKLIDMEQFSSKQKVLLAICFLLIAIALLMISKLLFKKKEIDYSKVNADTFITQGEIITDREIYWSLNEIISNIIASYKNIGNSELATPNMFYDVLTDEYSAYLGRNKFNKVMDEFLQKFLIENSYTTSIKTTRIISEVYNIGSGKYICELSPSKEGAKAYIGIVLNQSRSTYNIFYLE